MRILHFSDIHLGSNPKWSYLFDKRILGSLNYSIRRQHKIHYQAINDCYQQAIHLKPDLVICTGDLTSIGASAEFAHAQELLAPFYNNKNWEFIYIPGNHDAYVKKKSCQEALHQTFAKLNQNRWSLHDAPFIYQQSGVSLFIDMQVKPTCPMSSNGFCNPNSISVFNDWLKDCKKNSHLPLLVGHYPLYESNGIELSWRRCLKGATHYRKAIKNAEFAAALCGHIHHPYIRQDASGSLEFCAGSLTMQKQFFTIDCDPCNNSITYEKHQV